MNHEIILRPSRVEYSIKLLGTLLFLYFSTFILRHPSKHTDILIAYLCAGFFGYLAILFILQLIPGWSFLRIHSQGIQLRSRWRTLNLSWSNIEEFGVYAYTTYIYGIIPRDHKAVGLRLSPTYEHEIKHQWIQKLDKRLFGYDMFLDDSYGMKKEKLVKFLNDMRSHYTKNG
jgi:hypothetical protein